MIEAFNIYLFEILIGDDTKIYFLFFHAGNLQKLTNTFFLNVQMDKSEELVRNSALDISQVGTIFFDHFPFCNILWEAFGI